MAPGGDSPLIGFFELAGELCNQLEFKNREMLHARIVAQSDFVILPSSNELRPIGVAMPETSSVDQIQNFAGDRTVAHRKIDAADDWNAPTSNRFAVQEIHQFDQLHDVDRALGEQNEASGDLGRFLRLKWKIGLHLVSRGLRTC